MPLRQGSDPETISSNISEMSKTHPQDQAVAAALEESRADAEFKEEDHPRGEDGKFGSGGGSSTGVKSLSEKTAKVKNKVAREMSDSAFEILAKYTDKAPDIETWNGMSNDYAVYSPSNDKIFVSTKINSKGKENLELGTKNGFYSQPNAILHEVGHYLANHNNPEGFERLKNADYTPQEKDLIMSKVSKYATTNGSEFMAEYISGRLSGKEYGEEIDRIAARTISFNGTLYGLLKEREHYVK